MTMLLFSELAAVGRTEKYQMTTAPPTSTMAASSTNFQRSSRVRRASGNDSRAARISSESER